MSYIGLNARNLNDLLINQEISKITYHPKSSIRSNEELRRGSRAMQESSVTLIGVAKNVGSNLPNVLRQIEHLAGFFAESRAIFVHGDSTDGTDQTLKVWASKSMSNRTILSTSSIDEKEVSGYFQGRPIPREGRIAKARNVAMDALAALPTQSQFVIAIDMDILGWDPNGVLDSFSRPGWDVMCSHGILLHGIYRDTYAFRYDGINTNHHWGGKDHSEYNISASEYTQNRARLKASQKRAREIMDSSNYQPGWWSSLVSRKSYDLEPIQVKSCFGGLAIYRYEKMKHCRYSYRHEAPPYMLDCEHVLFHECITKNGQAKILSNFNMKLWYGHSQLSSLSFKKVWSSISMT